MRLFDCAGLIGSNVYTIIAIVVMAICVLAHSAVVLTIPIVIMGLSLLAGGTWFFVQWRTNRVAAAWGGLRYMPGNGTGLSATRRKSEKSILFCHFVTRIRYFNNLCPNAQW